MKLVTGRKNVKLDETRREAIPCISSLSLAEDSSDSIVPTDESVNYVFQSLIQSLAVKTSISINEVAAISS